MLLAVLYGASAYPQPPGWQWAQGGGGGGYPGSTVSNPGRDDIYSSAFDSEGNLIVGGRCTWTPRFDTIQFPSVIGSTSWQGSTMYMAKYDPCGQVQWVVIGGGNGSDYLGELVTDKNDNIYSFNFFGNTGTAVNIICPDMDTILPANGNTRHSFAKWDKNGNLMYLRTFPYNPSNLWNSVQGNGMKILKNGTILTMVAVYSSTGVANIQNFTVPNNSYNFAIFDTLGNVLKVKTIDTTYLQGTTISKFVVDDNENIYFSIGNVLPSISILGTNFNPALQYNVYLIKTDTSFTIKNYVNCGGGPCGGPMEKLNYNKGYFFGVGRRMQGNTFLGDTCDYNDQFTVFKMDTNLNLVWSSKAQSQNAVNYTEIFGNGNTENVYLALQQRGTVVWDSVTMVTPANQRRMAIVKLRASDGFAENNEFTEGNIYQSDQFNEVKIDPQGNPYFLGEYRQSIGVPTDTIYANGGLNSPDFFILKWGLPCTDTLNSLNSPEAPDALIATAYSSTDVNVEWHNNATYRLGFKLFRSPNGTSNWQQIATTGPNTFSYNDGGLTPATTYWYKVLAYTTGGESAFSNIDSATTFGSVCSAAITRTNADSVYTFNANPTGFGSLSYQWSNNGSNFSTTASPSLTLSTPGTYSICVTVTDAANCTATDCDTVIITPFVCNASLAYTNADSVYSFVATGTGTAPFSYAWSNNGTAFSGGVNAQQILDNPGTYNICVTVTDANNCQSSDCEVIIIAAPDTCSSFISFTVSGGLHTFSATNTGTAPFTYEWVNNGTAFSAAATPSITLSAGSNNVCVSVTDANNCKSTDCELVLISNISEALISEVELFPNPFSAVLYVGVASSEQAEVLVTIHDLSGREVMREKRSITSGKNLLTLNTQQLSQGVYELNISGEGQKWRGKIIKATP